LKIDQWDESTGFFAQINQPTDATVFLIYYPDFYLQLNMFRTSPRPPSGAQQL